MGPQCLPGRSRTERANRTLSLGEPVRAQINQTARRAHEIADSALVLVRAGSEIVVLRCAREPATSIASLSHRGGTAWPILTAEARCWILTRTLR